MSFKKLKQEVEEKTLKKYTDYFKDELYYINRFKKDGHEYQEKYQQAIDDFFLLDNQYVKPVFKILEDNIELDYRIITSDVSVEYDFLIDLMKDKRFTFKDFYTKKKPTNDNEEEIQELSSLRQKYNNTDPKDTSQFKDDYLKAQWLMKPIIYDMLVYREGNFDIPLIEAIFISDIRKVENFYSEEQNIKKEDIVICVEEGKTILNKFSYGNIEIENIIFKQRTADILTNISYEFRNGKITEKKLSEIYETFKDSFENDFQNIYRIKNYNFNFDENTAELLFNLDFNNNKQHVRNFQGALNESINLYNSYDNFKRTMENRTFDYGNGNEIKPFFYLPNLYLNEYSKDLNNYRNIFLENASQIIDYYDIHIDCGTLNFKECINSIEAIKKVNDDYSITLKIENLIQTATNIVIEQFKKTNSYYKKDREDLDYLMYLCEVNNTDRSEILNIIKEQIPEIEQDEYFEKNVLKIQLHNF